ncbi:hypothetical protein [Vreelandella arcis]|uniref:hypothetical protein n=1 Tax=Vreelandella arcis TaxID=416873 RepID=UPI00147B5165|nr:hypothetical protein [Halomonas arcis]
MFATLIFSVAKAYLHGTVLQHFLQVVLKLIKKVITQAVLGKKLASKLRKGNATILDSVTGKHGVGSGGPGRA